MLSDYNKMGFVNNSEQFFVSILLSYLKLYKFESNKLTEWLFLNIQSVKLSY